MDVITVTELLRNFREYIGRVTHGGERFLLSRGGETVAELRGVASGRRLDELANVLDSLPRLSEEDAEDLARDLAAAREELEGAPGPPSSRPSWSASRSSPSSWGRPAPTPGCGPTWPPRAARSAPTTCGSPPRAWPTA